MNKKNEAIVQNLIEKRNTEPEETPEEREVKEFKPGQYEISSESSLTLENLSLKLELVERQKHDLEIERHRVIAQVKEDLGVPDGFQIVGGTADFKKVVIEKRKEPNDGGL